jgi:small GTP-binding protein
MGNTSQKQPNVCVVDQGSQWSHMKRRTDITDVQCYTTEKVALIGDTDSGKSSLISRARNGEFQESSKTIGTDVWHMYFDDETTNTTIDLQIFDTTGTVKYKTIVNAYLKGSTAVAIVFDCTSLESFQKLSTYIEQVKLEIYPEPLVIYIVRNKVDKQNQLVSMEQTRAFANEMGCFCIETSAKTGLNVDELFMDVASHILSAKQKMEYDAFCNAHMVPTK